MANFCGSCRTRTTRLPRLPCGPCRRRARHALPNATCPFARTNNDDGAAARSGGGRRRPRHRRDNTMTKRSVRRRAAITTALLACVPISSMSSPAAMAFRFEEGHLHLRNAIKKLLRAGSLNENEERDVSASWNDDNEENVHHSYNSKKDAVGEDKTPRYKGDCSRDTSPWRQVIGATLLLNVASSLLRIIIYKFETNQRQWCLGGSRESKSCLRATVGAALVSVIMIIMTARRVLTKASELVLDWAQQHHGLEQEAKNFQFVAPSSLALSGFFLPFIITSACRQYCFVSCRSDNADKNDLATVNDEDDCLSCETCQLNRNNYQPDEPSTFTPPDHVDIKYHGDEDASGRSWVVPPAPDEIFNNKMVWRVHIFIHGLFVGAAATILSCSWGDDSLFMLICAIALCHGIHLERKTAVTATFVNEHAGGTWSVEIWLRGMFSRSSLTLGGMFAAAECSITTSRDLVVGVILAVAGGAYANIALSMTIAQVKHHWTRQWYDSAKPTTLSHYSPRHKFVLEDDSPDGHCKSCDKTKSMRRQLPYKATHPIPLHMTSQPGAAARRERGLSIEYDRATWNMYTRIVSAREARAKCEFCMGSMEEDEETAIAAVGRAGKKEGRARDLDDDNYKVTFSTSEEERRLIRTCPSPLYLEIDNQKREGTETTSLMMVHQECYYGATGEHVCPHRKKMAFPEENNMIFQLEL